VTQPGLFPAPDPGPVPQSRTIMRGISDERPHWARCRPRQRVQCIECVMVLHENGGQGPAVRGARWRLTIGKGVWYLCEPHAELRKKEQGVE
jgi:hypothetical protein